jgi:hypothetical protein
LDMIYELSKKSEYKNYETLKQALKLWYHQIKIKLYNFNNYI